MSKKLHEVDNDTSDYILRAASIGAGKSRSTVVLIENNAIINNNARIKSVFRVLTTLNLLPICSPTHESGTEENSF